MTHDEMKKAATIKLATFLYDEMPIKGPPGDFAKIMVEASIKGSSSRSYFAIMVSVAWNLIEDEDYEVNVSDLVYELRANIAEDAAARIRD